MVSMALVDICWTKYFLYVAKHKALPAAVWGSLIMIFGAFTTINYIEDKTLLVAAILGGFIGTYFTVRREEVKNETSKQDNI